MLNELGGAKVLAAYKPTTANISEVAGTNAVDQLADTLYAIHSVVLSLYDLQ